MNSRRVATANLALLLSMSALVSAQEKVHWDVVSKIREESFERSQVMDHIWYLSDVIGPRLAGSAGIGKAQLWARSKMDEMGLTATALEPWGETGVSWEQKYTSIHMIERRCCTARSKSLTSLMPVAESPGAVRIGHPERGHLVEYLAPNSVFNSLPRQRSCSHLRPDDRFVTIDRVLHHASLGEA